QPGKRVFKSRHRTAQKVIGARVSVINDAVQRENYSGPGITQCQSLANPAVASNIKNKRADIHSLPAVRAIGKQNLNDRGMYLRNTFTYPYGHIEFLARLALQSCQVCSRISRRSNSWLWLVPPWTKPASAPYRQQVQPVIVQALCRHRG